MVVPGDDTGAAQLPIDVKRPHLRLKGVLQLFSGLKIPNKVRSSMVLTKPKHTCNQETVGNKHFSNLPTACTASIYNKQEKHKIIKPCQEKIKSVLSKQNKTL